jgi:L-ascorbate metabolism protein UlaG (beta-lactamase superfamily)
MLGAVTATSVRWLGHSCVELALGDLVVLTDPALTPRLGHLRRHHRIEPATIAKPDVILISHVHIDHLHQPSLRMFDRDVAVIAPAGAEGLLRRWGFRDVRPTRAGDTHEIGAVTVETVRAVHDRRRGPHTRVAADPVGYVLRAPDVAVYAAGDTDLFDEMGTWDPIDVALVPIWGWGSTLGDGHLDPRTAAQATTLIDPAVVVPVHWGTYSPIGLRRPAWLEVPAARFRAELDALGEADALRLLTPGGSLVRAPHDDAEPAARWQPA